MGLTVADLRLSIIAIVVHIAFFIAAWRLIRSYAPRLGSAYQKWGQRRLAAFSFGAVLLLSTNATSYELGQDQLWQAISKRNLLGLNVTSFMENKHPDIISLQQAYAAAQASPDSLSPPPAMTTSPKGMIFIAVEGLNPSYVNGETMPFLTGLMGQGKSFENHYSSGNNTLLGTLGLLYGQSPTFFFEQTAHGQKSLFIDSLNKAGFKTRVFGRGLESYRKIDSYMTNFSEPMDTKENTDTTIGHIASFIKNNPTSFSYYYYGDSHYPYNHSPTFRKFQPEVTDDYKFVGGDIYENREAIRNKYRNSLAEADHKLELLFRQIPWRDMIVVITGDHGEAMFENGRLSHSSSLEKPQTHTPLLLYYPGITPGHLTKTTSHLDIFPTAFEINGMALPKGAQGRSMLDAGPGMALVMHNNQNYRPVHAALISGRAKVIINLDHLQAPQVEWLYDDEDKLLRLADASKDVDSNFADYKRRFLLDGCGLYPQLAKSTKGSDQILDHNLRYCR